MRKLVLATNITLDGFAYQTVAADDELHEFYSALFDDTDFALTHGISNAPFKKNSGLSRIAKPGRGPTFHFRDC